MTEVSVILPTVRPHLLRRALYSIPLAARGVHHEVVVVADFAPHDDYLDAVSSGWVTWIVRNRRGVVDAANVGHSASNGRFVFLFNDESVLDEGALSLLYEEGLRRPRTILSPRHLPEFAFRYYGREFVPFVFVEKSLVDGELGGVFLDPVYRGFYADPDLSLRAIERGISLHVVGEAVLRHHNDHDELHRAMVGKFLEHDRAVFRRRWDHLGEFRDP